MASIKEFREIPLDSLTIGLGQVRMRDVSKDISELAESIRQVGLLEPIVVSPIDDSGNYEIITGQRRFLAHQELGAETIWSAVLDEHVDELTAKVLSVTENLVRRDLHSRDLVDVCTYLYRQYGSMKDVCEETGLSYDKVRKYVKYDQLAPELKDLVDTGATKLATALKAQQAATIDGETNVDEAILFAHEMEPMSGAQRSKIVKERQSNPTRDADDIIEDAKSGGKITQIVVTLTSEVHGALAEFAASEQTSNDDAAGALIRDGLRRQNLLDG